MEMKNFRNHLDTKVKFSDKLNLIYGGNAQGKTSILEAISYLCITKSFVANLDSFVLNFNSNFFEVKGKFEFENGVETELKVYYERNSSKKIFLNREEVKRFSFVINRFPAVILHPRSGEVTAGPPEERRKFFDMTIAQTSQAYTEELLNYRKILKQRNKVLSEISTNKIKPDLGIELLESWNENFINYAVKIIQKRLNFLSEFTEIFKKIYKELGPEEPEISYVSQVDISTEDDTETINKKFSSLVEQIRNDEIARGVSLIGPHRDEFLFKLNGSEIRRYASQGQHKTFLIALSIAKFFYIKNKNGETPVFIFDDAFTELDTERVKKLLDFIIDTGQAFITTTDLSIVPKLGYKEEKIKKIFVNSGKVVNG